EMQAFGWHKGKLQGVGQHDDTVMALWIATMAVRKGSGFVYELLDLAPGAYVDRAEVEGADTAEPPEDAPTPWRPLPTPEPTPDDLAGPAGLALVKRLGYVPAACLLSPV
ncbi:MAG: hypothetical protein KC613_08680, partial [Myxococcales bacterium]|nr:hypothetical protein [Myxococcales bacterium]